MSSVKYSQPDFYHFSRDSVELADYIVYLISKRNRPLSLCDYFAGSGIIGIEIALKSKLIEKLTLIEKQKDFEQSLEVNTKNLPITISYTICSKPNPSEKFDLIVANPPYFLSGEGRPAQNLKKQICHFMSPIEWGNWKTWARQSAKEIYFLGRVNAGPEKSDCTLIKSLSRDIGIFSLKEIS